MNKEQIFKHESLKLIVFEAEQHKESVAKIPKFQRGIVRIKEICGKIENHKPVQEQDLKGITDKKDGIKDELVNALVVITGALQSYAYEMKKYVLREKINFSASEFGTMSKSDLVSTAAIVIGELKQLTKEELADEGIAEADVARLKELREEFNNESNSPRKAIINRCNQTQIIADLIDEGWELKRESLDKLIVQFKQKDPEFYLKYQAAYSVQTRRKHFNNNGTTIVEENEVEESVG